MESKFCILVPVYNESETIQHCLKSIKKSGIDFSDVYIVDDGSYDNTIFRVLATTFPINNFLILPKNVGKTTAFYTAVEFFKLVEKYDWICTLDGDTVVNSSYKKALINTLESIDSNVVAICGQVTANKDLSNPFVAFRALEYFLTHYIYKIAQSNLNIVTVLPGCVAVIKSSIFQYLLKTSDGKVLTEDMDWTIRMHKENLGKVIFDKNLIVQTQDPRTLRDYIKQLHRWYRGLWQVYRKHKMYLPTKFINLELSFLAWEGALYGMIWLYKMVGIVISFNISFSNTFLMTDIALFALYVTIASLLNKSFKTITYFPVFYLIRMLNCFIFLYAMTEILILHVDKFKKLSWDKVDRYRVNKNFVTSINSK